MPFTVNQTVTLRPSPHHERFNSGWDILSGVAIITGARGLQATGHSNPARLIAYNVRMIGNEPGRAGLTGWIWEDEAVAVDRKSRAVSAREQAEKARIEFERLSLEADGLERYDSDEDAVADLIVKAGAPDLPEVDRRRMIASILEDKLKEPL